jgi:hypothetical protein
LATGEARVALDHPAWKGHVQLVALELEGTAGATAAIDSVEVLNPAP